MCGGPAPKAAGPTLRHYVTWDGYRSFGRTTNAAKKGSVTGSLAWGIPSGGGGVTALFCHITQNWRGTPLETLEVVVESIGATTTATGLEVHAWLDQQTYEKGRKVSDQQLAECHLKTNTFHGEWNYEIHPRKKC